MLRRLLAMPPRALGVRCGARLGRAGSCLATPRAKSNLHPRVPTGPASPRSPPSWSPHSGWRGARSEVEFPYQEFPREFPLPDLTWTTKPREPGMPETASCSRPKPPEKRRLRVPTKGWGSEQERERECERVAVEVLAS